jgi:hypothetical protein
MTTTTNTDAPIHSSLFSLFSLFLLLKTVLGDLDDPAILDVFD